MGRECVCAHLLDESGLVQVQREVEVDHELPEQGKSLITEPVNHLLRHDLCSNAKGEQNGYDLGVLNCSP